MREHIGPEWIFLDLAKWNVVPGSLGQFIHGLVVGYAALGIAQIGGLGEIGDQQRTPRKPGDVGALDEDAVRELAADGEVQIDGVGLLQPLIDRVGDAEAGIHIARREEGEFPGRGRW